MTPLRFLGRSSVDGRGLVGAVVRTAVRTVVVAVVVAVTWAPIALADTDPPKVLPGPWVRAGRPVVVRVPGASRVRAASGPWALPQGAASDEFVLQATRADLGLGELEVEDLSGVVRRVPVRADVLPAATPVRGVLGGTGADATDVVVDLASPSSLPTVPEAWLLFDEVTGDAADSAIPGPARAALAAWRAARPASESPAFEPLRLAPDELAFRAAAESSAAAPRLPQDVSVALLVVAGATLLLLIVVRRPAPDSAPGTTPDTHAATGVGTGVGTGARAESASSADGARAAWRRVVWICAPSAACLAWFAVASPLPGAVRATSFVVEGEAGATAFVRFETDVAAEVSFAVPEGASSAAVLSWDDADATVRDAEAGRRVRLTLPPAAVRIVAWRLAGSVPGAAGGGGAASAAPGGEARRWLRRLGLEPIDDAATGRESDGGGAVSDRVVLRAARGFRLIPAGAIRVATRK